MRTAAEKLKKEKALKAKSNTWTKKNAILPKPEEMWTVECVGTN